MFRRSLLAFLVVMLAAGAFASERDNAPVYPVFEWERNAHSHWQLQADGSQTAAQKHDIDEETMICVVCGTEVWMFDDGSADLTNYNEQGETVRSTSYDENGEITSSVAFIYEYDEDGNKTREYQFENDLYVAQTVYALNEEGENHPLWSESYYDDNTWARNEYDNYGNCIKAYTYDENDAVTAEITSEYALNDDGWYYEAKSTTLMEGATFISEYNQYGDKTYTYIHDPVEGVLFETRRVYEYKDGQAVSCKQYEKDVLVMESFYDEYGGTVKELEYLEDGTVIVYEYDEDGNLIEE